MGDPAAVLTTAIRPVGEIEELGHQEVREVATTGYGFHVSMLVLLDLDTDSTGAEHLEDLEAEVAAWLDREDRVRRLRLRFDLASMQDGMMAWARAQQEQAGEQPTPSSSSPPEGTYTTTIEWFDFGEPVDITVSDEDDLIDEDTLSQEMTDSASVSAEAGVAEDIVAPDDVVIDEDAGHDREAFDEAFDEIELEAEAPAEAEPGD